MTDKSKRFFKATIEDYAEYKRKMESMHNAADMLQLRLDNTRLLKDNGNLNEKLNEAAKEVNELKLRHIFEVDELKLEYEDKMEKIEKLNSHLQVAVEENDSKVLKLHEQLNEKEEQILEMKKRVHEDAGKKRIKEVQREIKVLQSENKYLKAKCHSLEQSNIALTTNYEKLKAEQVSDGIYTAPPLAAPLPTKNVAQGFMSSLDACDNQLQSELTELHALLKEKRKTIKEIKKKRSENWSHHNNHHNNKDNGNNNFKISALEDEIQKLHSENNTLRMQCNDLEICKSQLTEKVRVLEEKENEGGNEIKNKIEKLEKEIKERDETINWIEAKMLESFDSMANKTSEYEEKIKSLEGELKSDGGGGSKRVPKNSFESTLSSVNNHELLSNDGGSMKSIVMENPDNGSVSGMLFDTIDNLNERGISGGGKGPSSKHDNDDGPKTPKIKGRGGLRNIFSKSFRGFVRNRRHAKKLTMDHDVFYVSEKE